MNRVTKLEWPAGWPRTQNRKPAAFDMSLDRAVNSLREELRLLKAANPVLTHQPFRSGAEPGDPGVAVYFDLKGQRKVFACDRWHRVRDNVRALALTIAAMRGIARWGASDMMERAFTGFDALPPPRAPEASRHWSDVLGIGRHASRTEIEAAYRREAKRRHPDAGGTEGAMSELNAARDAALREVGT